MKAVMKHWIRVGVAGVLGWGMFAAVASAAQAGLLSLSPASENFALQMVEKISGDVLPVSAAGQDLDSIVSTQFGFFRATPGNLLPEWSRALLGRGQGASMFWSPFNLRAWRSIFFPLSRGYKSTIRRSFETAV